MTEKDEKAPKRTTLGIRRGFRRVSALVSRDEEIEGRIPCLPQNPGKHSHWFLMI